MTLEITIVPLLTDNYAYVLHEPEAEVTAVVDPSEAIPVLTVLQRQKRHLTHIFNTHHHGDHTGGNLELKRLTGAQVVGSAYDHERIPGLDTAVSEHAPFMFGSIPIRILHVPGHTRGQISFYCEQDQAVFTGDTLFAMGCGRLFEGTPAEMWASMQKLMALPDATRVYCGHEYTLNNGLFALSVEPDNPQLQERVSEARELRAQGRATLPSTIGLEKSTNPFLRPDNPTIRKRLDLPLCDDATVFGEIRGRKDRFPTM